jgi:anti-anti-sigma regulatory factor
MRWWRRRADHPAAPVPAPAEPAVETSIMTITEAVSRDTAPQLVARVERRASSGPVVVDVTAIPAFDSEGTAALVDLQAAVGNDRLSIVGFRQAAARLVGSDSAASASVGLAGDGWVIRRMRAIVVVDLRGAEVTDSGILAIGEASGVAAVNGEELLVVNVDEQSAMRLRQAGLSATTFVAPEPLPEG